MHYFYILKCKDGTLYCGSTNDLEHREALHNSGRGSKYVWSRGGGRIVYYERFASISRALKREAEVKGWTREEKMKLISNKRLLRRFAPRNDRVGFAAVFDMDGVIVSNTWYHFKSWEYIGKRLGAKVTWSFFKKRINGRRAEENIKHLAKTKLSAKAVKKLAEEKEAIYRRMYRKHIKPVKGLLNFLKQLKHNNIKIGMATSAPAVNVKFVLGRTHTKKYFSKIINSSQVTKGKPNPQVFLKTARLLGEKPKNCLVFEDALNGIQAARRAGMKVVALATTNKPKDLRHADLVVKDFSQLNIAKISHLFFPMKK